MQHTMCASQVLWQSKHHRVTTHQLVSIVRLGAARREPPIRIIRIDRRAPAWVAAVLFLVGVTQELVAMALFEAGLRDLSSTFCHITDPHLDKTIVISNHIHADPDM